MKLRLAQSAGLCLNGGMPQSIPQDKNPTQNTPAPAVVTFTIAGATTLPFAPTRNRLGETSLNPEIAAVINDRMAIYKAAKAIHKSPAYVMEFVNRGLVKAYRLGGSPERPRLAVDLSELLAVIDRETLYVPPAMLGRKPIRRLERSPLHRLAAAI